MQSGAEIDQINIEKDKSGVVGQIPELRRGSLVAALSQLSLREGHSRLRGGGRVRSTIDNIRLSTPISSPVKRSEQRKKQRFIPFFVCCWCKLFLELLTYVGIRRS